MDRLISLGVGTNGYDDYFQIHQDLSELARNLGDNHNYVTVSVSNIDEVVDDETDDDEILYDKVSLEKVGQVLMKNGWPIKTAEEIIDNLYSAGIVFCKRRD